MPDDPIETESADRNDSRPSADADAISGTPRWVKVFGLVVLMLGLLFIVLQVAGGGDHGPGRHGGGGSAPPISVGSEDGHSPPPGFSHGARR